MLNSSKHIFGLRLQAPANLDAHASRSLYTWIVNDCYITSCCAFRSFMRNYAYVRPCACIISTCCIRILLNQITKPWNKPNKPPVGDGWAISQYGTLKVMGSVVFLVVFLYFGVVHQEIQAKGCALLRGAPWTSDDSQNETIDFPPNKWATLNDLGVMGSPMA